MVKTMSTTQRIRTELFEMSQKDFGKLLGVSQSVVCDMEKNDSLATAHQKKIRGEARERKLPWRDEFFFDFPEDFHK